MSANMATSGATVDGESERGMELIVTRKGEAIKRYRLNGKRKTTASTMWSSQTTDATTTAPFGS